MAQRILAGLSPSILGRIIGRKERRTWDERRLPRRKGPLEPEPGPFDFGAILEDY